MNRNKLDQSFITNNKDEIETLSNITMEIKEINNPFGKSFNEISSQLKETSSFRKFKSYSVNFYNID